MVKKSFILILIAMVYGSCSYFETTQTKQSQKVPIISTQINNSIRVASSNTQQEVYRMQDSQAAVYQKLDMQPVEEEAIYQEQNIDNLRDKIGSMLMVGFFGTSVSANSQICRDIRDYNLGGVILFDYNPIDKTKPKNISSKAQLKRLTQQLKSCSRDGKLLIAVDQEGGKVQRLKRKYGFKGNFPKAKNVAKLSDSRVKRVYSDMAKELNEVGINYNLAPVVDLAVNRKNVVIYKLGRSFGSNPKKVAHYASIFIDAMRNHNIITSAKHFPGHGSSLGDTHKGFVDVTNRWSKKELEPYRILNQKGKLDTVMVAHVFNRKLDSKYPATLSKKIIQDKLRGEIGFNGVVITDDLQMGAITKHFSLRDVLRLSINAGDDILLFGNQLSPKNIVTVGELVDTIYELVQSGIISKYRIDESSQRVKFLKERTY